MVVNKIKSKLIDLGFTENEAKAYIELVKESPLTGYEIAKRAAIPSSKVYQVLNKLSEKSAVLFSEQIGKKMYMPVPPDELIGRRRDELDDLEHGLSQLKRKEDVSTIWNIDEYDATVLKAKSMIKSAEKYLIISIWGEELALLKEDIETAKISISIVHFGEMNEKLSNTVLFNHPIEDALFAEKGGRSLVMVKDGVEALVATIHGADANTAWSGSDSFVMLAEDYLKHDVYIMKIVNRFNNELCAKFGENYELLRDVFNDKEV